MLRLGDWVRIGSTTRAVVCRIYPTSQKKIEVVYLGEGDKAINEDAQLVDGVWQFVSKGPSGGYADKYDRLQEYVSILRGGR